MLKELCRQHTNLNEEEIEVLEKLNFAISYFSRLSGADIFIDCFKENDKKAVVVAHSRPENKSLYHKNIEGEYVFPQNEPMVFYTKKTGIVMSEGKAVNQENRAVLQKTVPIMHNDKIIAVLIEETDVTKNLRKNQHIKKVEKESEQLGNLINALKTREKQIYEKTALIQEMHHRTKNNLQTLCSIMNMQARRIKSEEAKRVLNENINRMKGMAAFHTVIMNEASDNISLNRIIEQLAANISDYASALNKYIKINISGEDIKIDAEKAQSIVLAVNEALTNSVKHGYDEDSEGVINIKLIDDNGMLSISIEDDGRGFSVDEAAAKKESMGIKLMEMLIEDKLEGKLQIISNCVKTTIRMEVKR